jgi:hypothetical protein
MSRVSLLWHSVRHTPLPQLAHRLALIGKRKFMAALGPRPKAAGASSSPILPVREDLSLPPFPPRRRLVAVEDGKVFLRYLNRKDPLGSEPDWHPRALEHGTRLEKLNLHYMEYLEALDDAKFQGVVEHWIKNNPAYRPGYWLDNWNSYALSIRCVVWMQQFAVRRERLDSGFAGLLCASLALQVAFLERNLELDICGNHLIKNIKALLWAGRFFAPSREASRWTQKGEALLGKEAALQILSDGMHEERSPAYHCQVFADLLECYLVMVPGQARDGLGVKLDAMAQVTLDLAHPDGLISLFNDGGLNMTYTPGECLAVWRSLRGRQVRPSSQVSLRHAGYFGIRHGEDLLLVDCGPIGPDHLPAHGHGDMLAFEWDVEGKRIVVDAGVFEYHPGKWRDYSRATTSHNTVAIDRQDQCEFWKAFRVGRRGRTQLHDLRFDAGRFVLEGSHDGYRRLPGSPLHSRRIEATTRRIAVEDRVTGGCGQAAQAFLLLHPDCSVNVRPGGASIGNGRLLVELRTDFPVEAVDAWWMPDFGDRRKTVQLRIDYGGCPCAGSFMLEATEQ